MIALVPATLLASACLTAARHGPASTFDGARAFEHLRQVVAIGPRPAGSPGAASTRAYITGQLSTIGLTVEEQPFEARTPLGPIDMVNLRATIAGSAPGPRLVIAGHYDTKLFRDRTFVGANDAGSSTAFLIEIARVLSESPLALPVEILFFDGEEAVVEWEGDDNTYGSRHYVQAAQNDGTLTGVGALVLVDMIADRDLRILRETYSTPWLTEIIWRHARKLGRAEFAEEHTAVLDDHLPFLRAGVPAVNLIDMDYAPWHTDGDTLDKVSPASLQAVGDVLLSALPEIQRRLKHR